MRRTWKGDWTLNSFNPRFQYIPAMIGMALVATVALIAMHFSLLNYFADRKVRDCKYEVWFEHYSKEVDSYRREMEYIREHLDNLHSILCNWCCTFEEPDKEKQAEEPKHWKQHVRKIAIRLAEQVYEEFQDQYSVGILDNESLVIEGKIIYKASQKFGETFEGLPIKYRIFMNPTIGDDGIDWI